MENINLVNKINISLILLLVATILKAEKLTIMTENLPPYQYLDNNKKITGIATARVRNVLSCANLNADFFLVPWSQAYKYVLNHKNSIIYSMAKNVKRSSQFYWIGIVGYTDVNIYRLKGRVDLIINNIKDLKQFTIGRLVDDFLTQILLDKGLNEKKNIRYYFDSTKTVKLLLNHRFDLIAENPAIVAFKIKNKVWGYDQLQKLMPIIKKRPLYMAMNRNSDKELVNRMKSCSKKLRPN